MNFRWSDFVAISAITAGALVPTALLMASRADSVSHAYRVIEFRAIPGLSEIHEDHQDGFRAGFELYQLFEECFDDVAQQDATLRIQVRFLEGQVMGQAAQELQERLILLEAELNAKADPDRTKRRHRRKGPPCRRPPTRRPGRRHPGR